MGAGHASKMGYRERSGWGGSYGQPTNMIPFKSESLTKAFDQLQSQALIGQAAAHESKNGHEMVAGDVSWELDYSAHGMLKFGMGAESAGLYAPAADLGNVFDLEIDKILNRHRFQSCRMGGLTISGEASSTEPILCSGNAVVYHAETSSTAFPALSLASNRVYFRDITSFRIGDIADALGASDNLAIKSFEVSLDNGLQTDGKDSSGPNVLDPLRNGFRKATLKIGLARVDAAMIAGLLYNRDNGSRMQAQLVLSNGAGGSFTFNFPQGKIIEGLNMPIGGPGVIEDSFTLELFNNNDNGFMATSGQFEIAT